MKFNLLNDYISERYGNLFGNSELATFEYSVYLRLSDIKTVTYSYGFVTYKLVGDAVILHDMYVKPEFRNQNFAWSMLYDLKQIARLNNKSVIITFTEKDGQNQHLGERAVLAGGFKPAFNTEINTVYIRGTN